MTGRPHPCGEICARNLLQIHCTQGYYHNPHLCKRFPACFMRARYTAGTSNTGQGGFRRMPSLTLPSSAL